MTQRGQFRATFDTCTTALQPLHALIERHVLAAERLHGDDTTVPILDGDGAHLDLCP